MIKFLDLKSQYGKISKEIDGAIQKVISTTEFIGGSFVKEFENEFAEYLEIDNCIGVGNGTDALEIALEALNLPAGSEIIVPANSFISTAEAVSRTGHRIVFADCNPETYVLDLKSIKRVITQNTTAVIAVHLYGFPCDMTELCEFAKAAGLAVVEDCAQAHGTELMGQKVGTFGDVSAFSFYPGKTLGAYGDGGAIVTRNTQIALKCRMIANHGRVGKYDHDFEGRNSRLDGIQAAILSAKLKYLDDWIQRRAKCAEFYFEQLSGIDGLVLPPKSGLVAQSYHLFVIRLNDRSGLMEYLRQKKIETGIHYPTALPNLRAFSYLGAGCEDWYACRYEKEILSLPIGEHLNVEELTCVVASVREYLNAEQPI